MSNIDKYTKFMTEQAKTASTGLFGTYKTGFVTEADKKANKDPHADMEDQGYLHFHTTPEGHHIYAHDETDRGESLHYAVKHADGKVTHHDIEHGGEPVTDKQLNSDQKWHSVSKADIPNDNVRKAIHKDIKDETADNSMNESKTYSMDYDGEEEDTKGAKALDAAHAHFQKQGYTISHEGSDDPKHKERKNADITYHYAMGDDMHHAFTIHKGGKAANDPKIKALTKNLEDVTN